MVDSVERLRSGRPVFPGKTHFGQPTVFHPGRHFHVLQVTFSESQIFWILNGNAARAGLDDAVIPQNLFDLSG